MKLYFFPVAPNPTKVRLYLAEKCTLGCEIEVEQVPVNLIEGEQKKPEHLARNPFGVLPVLELDSGQYLIESLSIIDYLEDLYPEPSIWGKDAESRAISKQIERITDLGVLGPVGGIVHSTNSPLGLAPNPAVAAYFREKLKPKLDYLERLLGDGRPFLVGDSPSVADCTLASAFAFGRFRDMDFIEGYPQLQRWQADYRLREAIAGIIVS